MFLRTTRLVIKVIPTPHYSEKNSLYYSLINRKTLESVGYVAFQNLDAKEGTATLAYRTYTNHQKKGYMKEALAKVVDTFFYVFPLTTLKIEIKNTNIASLKTIKVIPNLIDKTPKVIKYNYKAQAAIRSKYGYGLYEGEKKKKLDHPEEEEEEEEVEEEKMLTIIKRFGV